MCIRDRSKRWSIKISKYLKFETVTKSKKQKIDRSEREIKRPHDRRMKKHLIQKIHASKDRYKSARLRTYINRPEWGGGGGQWEATTHFTEENTGKTKREKTQKTDGLITWWAITLKINRQDSNTPPYVDNPKRQLSLLKSPNQHPPSPFPRQWRQWRTSNSTQSSLEDRDDSDRPKRVLNSMT